MRWNATRGITLIALAAALLGGCQSAAGALGEPPAGTAIWEGDWDSDEYGAVYGDVAAFLPDPLPEGEFTAPAAIHYAFISIYRPNSVVRTSFAGLLRPGDEAGGTNEDDPITDKPFRLAIEMKGGFRDSDQILEYRGTLDETGTRLVGEYTSESPYDHGTFELERVRDD